MSAVIQVKRGTTDAGAANVVNSGELALRTDTPKLFAKTATDAVTTPIWIGAQIESSPGDWTSTVKIATQSAINTTFMPKAGGSFSGDILLTGGSDIRFVATGDGSKYVAFQAPASVVTGLTWTLPGADGSNGQVLSTNGTGTLAWISASSATTVTTTSDNTNATRYLVFAENSGSSKSLFVDDITTPLSYNPSTGDLTVAGNIVTSAATATLFNTTATTLTAGAAATTLTLGYGSTGTSTTNISTGAVASAFIKTINIGTGGGVVSTTNVNLGSANGGTVTVNKDLVVSGDLTVNGTTTTVNSATLTIDDPNIVLNSIASPTDILADGGGITLKGGASAEYTLTWVNATDAWTSNQNFNISSASFAYYINGASVLNSTTLGTGITTSSLTTVGIIGSGTWQGTAIAGQYGGTGVANTGKTITLGGNLTTSGAHVTTITTTGTTNVTLPLSGTLATLDGAETLTQKILTSPTLTGPALGTPVSGVLTSCTGLPVSTGISGLGTDIATFLATPGAGIATFLATPSSSNLAAAVTGETGTGALVFATTPTFTTSVIGGATMAVFNTVSTNISGFGAATTMTLGATTGNAYVRNPVLTLGNTTNTIATNSADANHLTIAPFGNLILLPQRSSLTDGDIPTLTITNSDLGVGQVQIEGGDLYLGNKSTGSVSSQVNIIFEGYTADAYETTLTATEPTGVRTLTLPDATDTLVGKATTDTLTNKSIAANTSGNTITGLVNANLSGTAAITNANLANSSVTIGSTSVSLGATVTTFAGLTSVTSTGFTGALTGNASTATTAGVATLVTLTATNSTAASHYIVFSDSATGNEDMRTDTSLFYNPSTNVLTCGSLDATVDGGSY